MSSTSDLLSTPRPPALPPALLALFLQVGAWLAILPLLALGLPLPPAILLQGGLAFMLARLVGMPGWWQLISLTFSPLAWLVAGNGIDPRWFLGAFILLLLTSAGSLLTRVPLYLSSDRAVEEVARLLPERPDLEIIDLGSGLGGMLSGLARKRSDLRLHGIEMAPLNWLVSRLRLWRRARIRLGSVWQQDLSGFDVVYAYLSPAPMPRLWQKVLAEMKPGSLFISNSFAIPGVEPDATVELHDLNHSRLLIWRR